MALSILEHVRTSPPSDIQVNRDRRQGSEEPLNDRVSLDRTPPQSSATLTGEQSSLAEDWLSSIHFEMIWSFRALETSGSRDNVHLVRAAEVRDGGFFALRTLM